MEGRHGGGGGGRRRGGRVRVAHATRVRDALGAPSRCGGPRERGPHTCKRTLLRERAEPKNRSLKCNDIVVFNARLFKTGPFVFLGPARYFWRLPAAPSTRPPDEAPSALLLSSLTRKKTRRDKLRIVCPFSIGIVVRDCLVTRFTDSSSKDVFLLQLRTLKKIARGRAICANDPR